MTLTMLTILALQTLLGALDNVLHHELTERLPSKPSARRELALHSAREGIYGVLFMIFAWVEPSGLAAAAVLALLLSEVAITITDFIEEDRTRRLPPLERALHTVLAVLYGTFLALVVPWLAAQMGQGTGVAFVSHGLFSWFFTCASIGVLAFSVRNIIAVQRLGRARSAPIVSPHSGRTVLVTGATGFIGAALVERLLARGDRVFVLTRDARQSRALFADRVRHVETLAVIPRETRIDAVVNLAGAPIIGLPWTAARKREIWRSRVDLTNNLVDWMGSLQRAPAVLVSGSAIGIYGDRGDTTLNDDAGAGTDFAAMLCLAWEQAAMRAAAYKARVVCLRIGLVLDPSGGPLPMMALPARFGLGAVLGSGMQWMSWIARADLLRMIMNAIDDTRWAGAINAVAPEPLCHADFQRALARTLHRPLFLQAPAWALKLLLGEMSSIFLFSQRVLPETALRLDFAYDVAWAADALDQQLGPPPRPLPQALPIDNVAPQYDAASDEQAQPADRKRA
ncbi:MAG: TIGR01777 family oxidoreductase [Alphaproteobacteria bacterium]|nr:TIGR01777 family oxidoreductase [Alphaproteobacteria bacterium]